MTEFQKYAKYSRFQVVSLPEYVTVAILKGNLKMKFYNGQKNS